MIYRNPEAGWCLGFNRASPHWTDMLLATSDGRPLCQTCAAAWRRNDRTGSR